MIAILANLELYALDRVGGLPKCVARVNSVEVIILTHNTVGSHQSDMEEDKRISAGLEGLNTYSSDVYVICEGSNEGDTRKRRRVGEDGFDWNSTVDVCRDAVQINHCVLTSIILGLLPNQG